MTREAFIHLGRNADHRYNASLKAAGYDSGPGNGIGARMFAERASTKASWRYGIPKAQFKRALEHSGKGLESNAGHASFVSARNGFKQDRIGLKGNSYAMEDIHGIAHDILTGKIGKDILKGKADKNGKPTGLPDSRITMKALMERVRALVKANPNHDPKTGRFASQPEEGEILGRLWNLDLDQKVPVIWVSGQGMGEASESLSDARRWAKDHVAGESVNKATGWRISVSSKGIGEAIAHLDWSKSDTIRTLAAIPDIIREAITVQSAPDTKTDRRGIAQVHTFVAPIEVAGQIYRVRMTVRETNMGHRYYGHRLESLDIETPEAFSRGGKDESDQAILRRSGEVSVGQLLQGFKPHTREKKGAGDGTRTISPAIADGDRPSTGSKKG